MARMSSVMRARPLPFRSIVVAAALLLAAGCAPRTAPPATPAATATGASARGAAPRLEPSLAAVDRGTMATELDPFFAAPGLRTAVWSVLVQSLDSGEVVYRLNPDTLVMPASNQKIVSTAVAAARLGWDFRFETRLETAATVTDGVLRGDLIVAGNGDPTVNNRDGRRESFFDEMAAALKSAGISRVEGRLVGDDNAFDEERFGFGWQWDDFVFGYAAPVGPLQVNEGIAEVVDHAGAAVGAPAGVAFRQAGAGSDLVLVTRVTTGPKDSEARVSLDALPGQRLLHVSGTVPLEGKEVVRNAAVDNPTLYFVAEAKTALAGRGVVVSGDPVDIDDLATADGAPGPASRRVIGRLPSPPLADVARPLMKVSQNLYAETVMRALSLGPAPASMESSKKAVEETLSRWGVPSGSYVVADGSGLSRNNYVNASMLVAILRAMARDATLADAVPGDAARRGQGRNDREPDEGDTRRGQRQGEDRHDRERAVAVRLPDDDGRRADRLLGHREQLHDAERDRGCCGRRRVGARDRPDADHALSRDTRAVSARRPQVPADRRLPPRPPSGTPATPGPRARSRPTMMPSDQVIGNLPPKASLSHTIFRPTKTRTTREAVLEHVELVDRAGQQEVHRAQAEDREHVRREHDQRLAREREDRGHGVDGEDDVAHLEKQERDEERRGEQPSLDPDEETLAVQVRRHRHEPLEQPDERVLVRVNALLRGEEHLDAREDEEARRR